MVVVVGRNIVTCTVRWRYIYIYIYIIPCGPPCVGCSLMEQKLDQLTDRAADLTKRQLEREDTALEYKRCMHACLLQWY